MIAFLGVLFPAWGGAGLFTYVGKAIGFRIVVRNLRRSGFFAQELAKQAVSEGGIVRFDEENIVGWLAPQHHPESIGLKLTIVYIASAAIGIATGWLLTFAFYGFYGSLYLKHSSDAISPILFRDTGYFLSAIIPVLIVVYDKVRKPLDDTLSEGVQATAKQVGLREIEDRLRPLKTDIHTLGAKIGLDLEFPPQLVSNVYEYVKKASMLSEPEQRSSAELHDLFLTLLHHAGEYSRRLREAGSVYDDARRLWKEISLQLIETRSESLAKKFESDYGGLVSQIEDLVADQKGDEFRADLDAVVRGLTDLRERATRYMRQGIHGDALQHDPETEERRACRILGVPVNAFS